ncbi:hypothetical protein PTTG_28693 [Puccinia triticina 1-1 BBBD Race 1]|uniref:DDE Tnp4 domain-containing protein n=1 Tax=Puccinia triticina (isolate 1-1 / race 1 (BBBD)) TaxID=630390 RepID=A0A180G9R4_PUCT1|nr:hypothetical protein PTTG_28693 [Puccinia triticina 1-1 BBBD Race 1]
MNSMIVCTRERHIIYALHGWCGSAHDQRVYKNSQLFIQPNKYFSPGKYLLADSGYTASKTVIPAFKQSPGQQLTATKQAFNFELSHQQVEVEHCIGMLKNRWQSLKLLRQKLCDMRSARRLNQWLKVLSANHGDPASLSDVEAEAPEPEERPGDYEDSSRKDELFQSFCKQANRL